MAKTHPWLHWLVNVLSAAAKFLVFGAAGFYLSGVAGTMTQIEALKFGQNWPVVQFSVRWLEIKLNYPQNPGFVWWTIVVWLPLTLMGLSAILINGFNLVHTLSDPQYNRIHCPFCRKS